MTSGGDSPSSPRTPTSGPADELLARRLVRMSTGLTVNSTTSSTGSGGGGSSSSQVRSARRSFYEFLIDIDNQLQLAVAVAEKATADIEQWRVAAYQRQRQQRQQRQKRQQRQQQQQQQQEEEQEQEEQPGHMAWFRSHLDELLGAQLTQLEWDVGAARSRLEQLLDDGVIRESTLLRPQPKKYTTARMRAEVRQMEHKLDTLHTHLLAAQAAWKNAFAPWIQK